MALAAAIPTIPQTQRIGGAHTVRSQTSCAALILGLLGWWIPAPVIPESATLSLPEALEALREQGLETVYTSRWVTPDLSVPALPKAGPPGQRLSRLLDPFELRAVPTDDGYWIIERKPLSVDGQIVADPGGDALPGSRVRVLPDGPEVATDADGRFKLFEMPAGTHALQISRPGFQTRRQNVRVTEASPDPKTFTLRLASRWSSEVWVSESPPHPPVGSFSIQGDRLASTLLARQDTMAAVAELPGVVSENGVMFGVRGQNPQDLTVVVDGIELVEPYHLRDLGGLAGVVTPDAIGEAVLHRGSPPLSYGNHVAGVLELITEEAEIGGFSLGIRDGTEARQGGIRAATREGAFSTTLSARRGAPEIPTLLGEFPAEPSYDDLLMKLAWRDSERHGLQLEYLGSIDEFPFERVVGNRFERFRTDQEAEHSWIRYRGQWGSQVTAELTAYRINADRNRLGNDSEGVFFAQPDGQIFAGLNLRSFQIMDLRSTEREGQRAALSFDLGDRFGARVGAERRREKTIYDYEEFVTFKIYGPDGQYRTQMLDTTIYGRRDAFFGSVDWRPTVGLTLELGWRGDWDSQAATTLSSPRAALAWRRGNGLLRLSLTRAHSLADTHELQIADNELSLPSAEATDIWSVEYRHDSSRTTWAAELFGRQTDHPRARFENLYQPVSRFPELEIDRILLAPDRARGRGLELGFEHRRSRWRATATYTLSNVEERLDGHWRPLRTDRRHGAVLTFESRPFQNLSLSLVWRGQSGAPTTPFDMESGRLLFASGIGEYHSDRLPATHRLDVRLGYTFRWRQLRMSLEGAVENLYDHRRVRGFSLIAIDDANRDQLPEELGLGRRFLWGVELAWGR